MAKLRNSILGAILACSWACGGPEHATVDQFFRAARSDDGPTVAAMSAVGPPGKIEEWKVVEVTSRTTEAFALPRLVEEFDEAKKERDATLELGREFMDEEVEALDQIIPKFQEDPEYKFSGRIGEIQEEWLALVETRREKERIFQDARRAKNDESALATRSVVNRGVTIENLDGDVAVSELLVSLKPEGEDQELPYTVTLRKYDLSNRGSDRIESARWVIVGIEGTTEEARAAAAAAAAGGPGSARADADTPARAPAAAEAPKPAGEQKVRSALAYQAKELRGLARVQILQPETKIEGNEVVSIVRVRNASKDWITQFTATEYWYDDQGTATMGGSRTHEGRFMPGTVIEMELRAVKNDAFYQNQIQFKHANGEVEAALVGGFPKSAEE